jgi:DNA-binding NarL/FixJ family response regulator
MGIRVLLVDDSCQICDQWYQDLVEAEGIEVVGCASAVPEALDFLQFSDILIVNTGLLQEGAYRLIKYVESHYPNTFVLIVGDQDRPRQILRYMEMGARGYLPLHSSANNLIRWILRTSRGEGILPPGIAGVVLDRLKELSSWYEEVGSGFGVFDSLTRREREILLLISRDYSNQDIANDLIIQVGTVKNHVHNILSKLDVSSRQEAASYWIMMQNTSNGKWGGQEQHPEKELFV